MYNILLIVLNYLVIQVSIIVPFLFFYFLYRRKHISVERSKNINTEIEKFIESKYMNYMVFWWAFFEASIWFVIPEFLLLLVIFFRSKNKRKLLTYDIWGTICGTFFAFYFFKLSNFGVEQVPYIYQSMLDQTRVWYEDFGVFALIFQPFSGVPYKVFIDLAQDYNLNIIIFTIFAVIVRLSRYWFVYVVLTGVYPLVHKRILNNFLLIFFLACFIFSFCLMSVTNVYKDRYVVDRKSFNFIKSYYYKFR